MTLTELGLGMVFEVESRLDEDSEDEEIGTPGTPGTETDNETDVETGKA